MREHAEVAQTVTVSPRADLDGAADASMVRLTSTGLRDRAPPRTAKVGPHVGPVVVPCATAVSRA